MGTKHRVEGINHLPIYVIATEAPWVIDEDDFIDGVTLSDLLARVGPEEHLYFVDYASEPGRTKLTCLI
jgi:hypothetical protein